MQCALGGVLQTAQAPVTFVGISTPLTWAATQAPRPVASAGARAASAGTTGSAGTTVGAGAAGATASTAGQAQAPLTHADDAAAAAAAGHNPGAAAVSSEAVQESTAGCLTAEDAPKR